MGAPKIESSYYEALPTRGDAGIGETLAEAVKSRDVLREVVLTLLQDRDPEEYDSDTRKFVMGYKKDSKGFQEVQALGARGCFPQAP